MYTEHVTHTDNVIRMFAFAAVHSDACAPMHAAAPRGWDTPSLHIGSSFPAYPLMKCSDIVFTIYHSCHRLHTHTHTHTHTCMPACIVVPFK